ARSGKANSSGKPWALFVSLVCPHFPLIARPEWYDLYPENEVPLPALYDAAARGPDHPYVAAIRECQTDDKGFDPASLRRAIAACPSARYSVSRGVGRRSAPFCPSTTPPARRPAPL